MQITSNLSKRGISIGLDRDGFGVKFHSKAWNKCPPQLKESIRDNLVYVKTRSLGFLPNVNDLSYNTHKPSFKEIFDNVFIKDSPRITDIDKVPTSKLIKNFSQTKCLFKAKTTKSKKINKHIDYPKSEENKAVLSISFGKDSLLSFAVAQELGLDQDLFFVRDSFDREEKHKLIASKRFSKEFNTDINYITDDCDKILNNPNRNRRGISIWSSNAMNGYLLMLMPIAYSSNARYVLFGNQQNMNDYFINEEGFRCYASYDQSHENILNQNKIVSCLTNSQVKVASLISPLYNIAIMKILHSRYKNIAKYQMSCSLDEYQGPKTLCQCCPKCVMTYIMLKAFGLSVKQFGFTECLTNESYDVCYPFFRGSALDNHKKTKEARDEMLLAFYLAYRKGTKGELMKRFKRKLLKEAVEREDELHKKFFSLQNIETIPKKIKKELTSIYKEELNGFF